MGGRDDICRVDTASAPRPLAWWLMSTFHDFEMTSITGDQVAFDQFEGQLCLIVNVASA